MCMLDIVQSGTASAKARGPAQLEGAASSDAVSNCLLGPKCTCAHDKTLKVLSNGLIRCPRRSSARPLSNLWGESQTARAIELSPDGVRSFGIDGSPANQFGLLSLVSTSIFWLSNDALVARSLSALAASRFCSLKVN